MQKQTKIILTTLIAILILFVSSCSSTKPKYEEQEIFIFETIQFGGYQWQVLETQEDRALIISKQMLEMRAYHTRREDTNWSNSSMRAYLNGEFYNSAAFSDSDRERIIEVTVTTENNQWYDTNSGPDTQDKIFLLSLAEVVRYFGDSGNLAKVNKREGYFRDDYNWNRTTTLLNSTQIPGWWLRSPGEIGTKASFINAGGYVVLKGDFVNVTGGGMRPAMWIQLPSVPTASRR